MDFLRSAFAPHPFRKSSFFFDVFLLGLAPLLTFFTINDSFSMFTALPLTLILLFRFFVCCAISQQRLSQRRFYLSVSIAVWLAFTLAVNALTHPEAITGKSFIRLFYIYSALVFFLLTSEKKYRKKELFLLCRFAIFSATVISLAIIHAFLNGGRGKISLYSIFGIYVEENYTGALLSILLMLGVFILKWDAGVNPLHYLEVWIICFGIFLTGSRAAMLASLCGGVIFFITSIKLKISSLASLRNILILLCLLAVGIYLIYRYVPAWTWERMFVMSYKDISNKHRVELWRNAFVNGFLVHPIHGWGIGNYGTLSLGKNVAIVAHNTYLTMLVDGGVVYFLLMLLMVFPDIKEILSRRRQYMSLLVSYFIVTFIVDGGRMFFFWYGLFLIVLIAECPDLMETEYRRKKKRFPNGTYRGI